ncbi:MAG TPA: hypothetical protein VN317_10635, partial [Candidatus Methanoperedens sp.]|nr:hypothetical protein [Candidatus Methanoperedens sp.]
PAGGTVTEVAPWKASAEPPPRAAAPPPAPPAASAPPASGELFAQLVERVRAAKSMLADFLEHGRLVRAGAGVIEIGFAPEDSFFLDTAREAENVACLRAAARELLGGRAEVRLTTLGGNGGAPETHEAPRESDRHRRLRHEALESDALRWTMEILEARVVEVKLEP